MIAVNFILFILLFLRLTSSGTQIIYDRIYHGQDLQPNKHRQLVKLDMTLNDGINSCSGSIIHKFWIISAAHCFIHSQKVEVFHHIDLQKKIAMSNYIIKHPQFDESTVINNIVTVENTKFDIAMIKTIQRIIFNVHIQPIALGHSKFFSGHLGVIAGFGLTEYGVPGTRQGNVRISKCVVNNDYVMCTKGKVKGGSGDSGGPLITVDGLVGVTSSYNPETKETYYASIYDNLPWIYEALVTRVYS